MKKILVNATVRALRNDFTEQLVMGATGKVTNVNADGTVDVDWGCGEVGFGYTALDVEEVTAMKKIFKVGERVRVEGSVNVAEVIGVNGDGTINLVWERGGYSYNRNPDDYVEAGVVEYKGLLLTVRTGDWDDVMNSCFYVTIDHIDGYYICVEKGANVMFARNDYGYVSEEFQ